MQSRAERQRQRGQNSQFGSTGGTCSHHRQARLRTARPAGSRIDTSSHSVASRDRMDRAVGRPAATASPTASAAFSFMTVYPCVFVHVQSQAADQCQHNQDAEYGKHQGLRLHGWLRSGRSTPLTGQNSRMTKGR